MKLIAIETTVSPGSIALEVDGDALAGTLPAGKRTAQSLAPALLGLFEMQGMKPRELDAVAVTTGPGSFTGQRIGVTTAKMLAYAAGAPVIELNTLAVLAAQAPKATSGWAVLDAQRREVFAAKFGATGEIGQTQILAEDAWIEQLTLGDMVIGPVLKRLADRLSGGVVATTEADWQPRAVTLVTLAKAKLEAGETVDPMQLAPRYYRKSAAEEKADAASK